MFNAHRRRAAILFLIALLVTEGCAPSAVEMAAGQAEKAAALVAAAPVSEATPYPTATTYPAATAYATQTVLPTATWLPTATLYPTGTPYPTATPYPTWTPPPTATPRPTLAPGAAAPAASQAGAPPAGVNLEIQLLTTMKKFIQLLLQFEGAVGRFNNMTAADCQTAIQAFEAIAALPTFDVSGAGERAQQANSVYRFAHGHFTEPDTGATTFITICRTEPENIGRLSELQYNVAYLRSIGTKGLLEPMILKLGG